MVQAKLTPNEMVRYLKDPYLLLRQTAEPGHAQPKTNSPTNPVLTKVLKEIELAIQQGSLPLAEKLLGVLDGWDIEITADERAWLLYHKGCLLHAYDKADEAEASLLASLECVELSWCYYKLAELCIKRQADANSDDLTTSLYFQRALQTSPTLSQEAEAYATNWLNDFFDANLYVRQNPDLIILDTEKLFSHFAEFGFREGRIAGQHGIRRELEKIADNLPISFDWKEYLDGNPDLMELLNDKNLTIPEAQLILSRHFIEHGQAEGRAHLNKSISLDKVPEDFYSRHKTHSMRLLNKKLHDFLDSGSILRIGDGQNVSITVIVVVYNKAAYTLECLKSLASSSRKDLRLVVVDNNSSDQTTELLLRVHGNIEVIRNTTNSHFLLACNQAVERVESEYLCFLNNDALLHEDTISEALSCLARYDSKAIVGGKVLHADGYIQDAGSIVFSDGSCLGLGRRCDPGHHLYSFERSVDYISGAFFAASSQLIRGLGCFDPRYAPAYYEETDLCFRAASQSIPIVYCPSVIITHYEFISSSGSQWAVKQMAKNQKLFCELHGDRLAGHLAASLFSPNKIDHILHGHLADGPRVLVIDDQIPSQQAGSGFSRSRDMLESLTSCCSFVTIFATDFKRSRSNAQSMPIGIECIEEDLDYLRRIIRERASFYDCIVVSRKHNQELFGAIAAEMRGSGIAISARIVFDAESLFSIRDYTLQVLQDTGGHIRSLAEFDLAEITRQEITRFKIADSVTCVSKLELSLVANAFPDKQCYLVGHSFPRLNQNIAFASDQREDMLFLGAVYEELSPNHDSLEWLHDSLLPALATLPPGFQRLLIAGNIKCDATLELISSMQQRYPFVRYLGLVSDLEALFRRTRLFLAPTRYAAGIPHKVHLASSHGVPTLTTSLIAEQIGWNSERALMLADTPAEFAASVHMAFSDPEELCSIRSNMIDAFNRDCDPLIFTRNIEEVVSVH